MTVIVIYIFTLHVDFFFDIYLFLGDQLLEVLPEFGYTLKDYAHIIVPAISSLIDITSEASLSVLLNSVSEYSSSNCITTTTTTTATTSSTSTSHSTIPNSKSQLDTDTIDLSNIFSSVPENNCTSTNDTNIGGIQASNTRTSTNGLNQQILPNKVGSVHLRKACLECLARFTDCVDLDDFAGQIIHPVCRLLLTLESCHQSYQQLLHQQHHLSSTKSSASLGSQACLNAINQLRVPAMDVLTGLLYRMGQKFKFFLPLVQKMQSRLQLHTPRFNTVLGQVSTFLSLKFYLYYLL